jgi:hypothetical protein
MELAKEFDDAMLSIYTRALKEANYKATRFFHMLNEHGGLETARILINAPEVSEGYTALWERGHLDLTVEALIHDNPRWHPLFTNQQLEKVRQRLVDYEYGPALGRASYPGRSQIRNPAN